MVWSWQVAFDAPSWLKLWLVGMSLVLRVSTVDQYPHRWRSLRIAFQWSSDISAIYWLLYRYFMYPRPFVRQEQIFGWWFGTFFHNYIGNNHPKWLIFFRGVETTNQNMHWFTNIVVWFISMGSQLSQPKKMWLTPKDGHKSGERTASTWRWWESRGQSLTVTALRPVIRLL